jgi:hypothetical protein
MARLLLDQGHEDQTQITGAEDAASATRAATFAVSAARTSAGASPGASATMTPTLAAFRGAAMMGVVMIVVVAPVAPVSPAAAAFLDEYDVCVSVVHAAKIYLIRQNASLVRYIFW